MVGLNKIFTPLIILLLAFFANYATSILLANIMSIENFGIINYALTLIPIAAQILLLGTGSSAKQFLNRYIYDHEENQTSSYVNWNINIIYWPLKISIILGFFSISLPTTNFCKLPPDKLDARLFASEHTTLNLSITSLVLLSR